MKLYHKKLGHFGDFWFGEYEINQTVQMSLNYALALGIHCMYTHTVHNNRFYRVHVALTLWCTGGGGWHHSTDGWGGGLGTGGGGRHSGTGSDCGGRSSRCSNFCTILVAGTTLIIHSQHFKGIVCGWSESSEGVGQICDCSHSLSVPPHHKPSDSISVVDPIWCRVPPGDSDGGSSAAYYS